MDQNPTLNGRIEQEFKDLDRGWVAAYLQGTTELFNRVWADGFIFTSPFGQFTNKEQEIADIRFRGSRIRVAVYRRYHSERLWKYRCDGWAPHDERTLQRSRHQRPVQLYQCIGKATAGALADSGFTCRSHCGQFMY